MRWATWSLNFKSEESITVKACYRGGDEAAYFYIAYCIHFFLFLLYFYIDDLTMTLITLNKKSFVTISCITYRCEDSPRLKAKINSENVMFIYPRERFCV
jgi:hypothetical protein